MAHGCLIGILNIEVKSVYLIHVEMESQPRLPTGSALGKWVWEWGTAGRAGETACGQTQSVVQAYKAMRPIYRKQVLGKRSAWEQAHSELMGNTALSFVRSVYISWNKGRLVCPSIIFPSIFPPFLPPSLPSFRLLPRHKASLCRPTWPWIHSNPASTSQVLGLQA